MPTSWFFRISTALAAATLLNAGAVAQHRFGAPLAEEPLGRTATLPVTYPGSWVVVHDLRFDSLVDGRATIVDVAADSNQVKGQIPVAQFGTILSTGGRNEIYVGETFHSRLTRGERTDTITIWDRATLAPKGEIVLPGGKRGQFVTLGNALQLTNGDKWALVFNFTPAASVTVIDLDRRAVLADIEVPGCSLIYPTGMRGFSSLCADGTIMTVTLDEVGKAASTKASAPINDIDKNPMFMTPATVGRTAWFATFGGQLHGIDFSQDVPRDLGSFGLPMQAGGEPAWRPGGWQVVSADAAGLIYVLMNPRGKEGSHKDGGTEVWVIDPARKALVRRVALTNPAISIEATRQSVPLLVAARADGALDVYDATTGKFQRTIVGAARDPMTMTAAR